MPSSAFTPQLRGLWRPLRGWASCARSWFAANRVGLGLVPGTSAYLDSLTGAELARILICGLTTSDLPDDSLSAYVGLVREFLGRPEYLLPPLPNTPTPATPPAGSTGD